MNCQNHLYRNVPPQTLARRWFLKECGVGLGAIALGQLANAEAAQAAADPLAPKRTPIRARAKNVIFLFMAGAPSHLELFDNKPQLAKFDGTLPPAELAQGLSGRVHQSEFEAAGAEVQIRQTWAIAGPSFRSCCRIWLKWSTTSRS